MARSSLNGELAAAGGDVDPAADANRARDPVAFEDLAEPRHTFSGRGL